LKIASIQMSAEIGEVKKNVEKAISLTTEAVEKGAKLVCLPEMFNTGYFCHTGHFDNAYFKWAEPISGWTVQQFQSIAKNEKVVIIVPFYEYYSPGVYYNSACVVDADGNIAGCYRKTHVGWSGTGWEKYYCKEGYELPVFNTSAGKIGVLICYDRDFPEAARTLGLKGAEIICIPNGASISLKKIWKNILVTRSYENQTFIVGSCFTGRTDEEHHEFCGSSMIVDPFGNVVSELDMEESVVLADIDLNQVLEARLKRFMYRDRRPEIYSFLVRQENEI